MYVPTLAQHFSVNFDKYVNENVNVHINKNVNSQTMVIGNLGQANADAKAFGYDTLAETLTLSYAEQGYGSSAFSESTSATNGYYGFWYIA